MAEHPGIPADALTLARAARQRDPVAMTALADRLAETGDAELTRNVLAFMAGLVVPAESDAAPLRKFLRGRGARPLVYNGIPYRLAKMRLSRGTTNRVAEATRMSRDVTLGDLLRVTRRELEEFPASWGMMAELTAILDAAGLHLAGDPEPGRPG